VEGSIKTTNQTSLTATFDLRGKTPGMMDVIIEVPGDTIYVFEEKFEIVEGSGPVPWANTIVPEFLTTHSEIIYMTYGNSGDVDAEGVPLWLAVSPNIDISKFGMKVIDLIDPESEYYKSIPEYALIDSLLGKPYDAKVYSFIIPRIPAKSSVTIPVTIKGASDGDFYTRAWTNEPMYGSPLKYYVEIALMHGWAQ